jgi:alkyl hydroperoxide reductase subunit AhpC
VLTVGDTLPAFKLTAVLPEDDDHLDDGAFITVMDAHLGNGLWTVLVAWPRDFTFVCPTEILGYDKLVQEFATRDTVVYGLSTNHRHDHLGWRRSREDLAAVRFPWLADETQEFSKMLGILKKDGTCLRATFIIDPHLIIRHVTVNNDNVGRKPAETLRVLDALRTRKLTPCGWKQGDPTL